MKLTFIKAEINHSPSFPFSRLRKKTGSIVYKVTFKLYGIEMSEDIYYLPTEKNKWQVDADTFMIDNQATISAIYELSDYDECEDDYKMIIEALQSAVLEMCNKNIILN